MRHGIEIRASLLIKDLLNRLYRKEVSVRPDERCFQTVFKPGFVHQRIDILGKGLFLADSCDIKDFAVVDRQ